MGERRPFVIVGAGIGGLTTALALAAKGFRSIVYERSPQLSEIGAGIQLGPNAGRVLAGLGLDDAIAARALEPATIDVMNGRTGHRLASVSGATFRSAYGFPYRVIHRADLQAILVAASSPVRARIELGTTVESVVPDRNGLLVRTRKSGVADVVRAEAVIGADGVWSAMRDKVPGALPAVSTGRTAWRAIVPADVAREIVAMDRVVLWLGRKAHLVHYPVAQGAAVNIVAIVEGGAERGGWTTAGDPDELMLHFYGWARPAKRILESPASWQKLPIAAVDPSGSWLGDRLVLLGDAAHAMPPFLAQGAAMAIEDAAVLADRLASTEDTQQALAAYVAERQPRVVALANASRRAGQRFHMSGIAGAARNLALRIAGEQLIRRQNDAIYRWRTSADAGSNG